MATWQEVKNKVVTFRNYIKSLTPNAKASAKYAFMITREDIKAMIAQAGGTQELDGIRAYFGADIIEGQMVPCIYFIAVKKDDSGNYNDYDLGTSLPSGTQPLIGSDRPCPTMCSTTNFLNS